MMVKKRSAPKTIVIIFLAIWGILTCLPFIWMVLSSFKTNLEITQKTLTFFPKNPVIENYQALFTEASFGLYLKNTVIVVIFSVFGIFLNAMAGYAFSKFDFKGKNFLFILVLATMMIPSQVTMIPLYLICHMLGLTNTLAGIVLPSLAGGYAVFLFRQFIDNIPDEYIEAARLDGAGELYIFRRIIIPLAKPILSIQAILTFVGAWNAYLWPLVIANDSKFYTLSVGLGLLQTQFGSKFGLMMAGATVMTIPILIVYLIFQKYITQAFNFSGDK